ncbi:MAG: Kelch repeat-containing protein [Candidatus Thorarchaeota archaeon]
MRIKHLYFKIIFGIIIGLICSMEFNSVNYSLAITNNYPSSRYGHEMVYDSKNNLTILFGGENTGINHKNLQSTWKFSSQSQDWLKIDNSISPSCRIGHKMIFNSITGKILLFGGMEIEDYIRKNDMWEFDPLNNEWTELYPDVVPSARSDHAMYFDAKFNIVVLFGGYLANDQLSSETWIYNCSSGNWHQINPVIHPTIRYGHEFVYDSNQNVGVFFGGREIGLTSETWIFNFSSLNWKKLSPSTIPKTRYFFAMAYDHFESKIIMFGGDNEQSTLRALDDTWTFNTSTENWFEVSPSIKPLPRNNHNMIFDSNLNKTLLFGGLGEDYNYVFDDFWSYDSTLGEWILLEFNSNNNNWWIILVSIIGPLSVILIVIAVSIIRRNKKN